MRASCGLAPTIRQPTQLCEPHGRITAPKFFRGGIAVRAKGTSSIALRLIQMGVWRDPSQPANEETGAVGRCIRITGKRLLVQPGMWIAHLTPAR